MKRPREHKIPLPICLLRSHNVPHAEETEDAAAFLRRNANMHSRWEGFYFSQLTAYQNPQLCQSQCLALLHPLCKVASVHKQLCKWAFMEFVTDKYT